jgi:hypothetical protein
MFQWNTIHVGYNYFADRAVNAPAVLMGHYGDTDMDRTSQAFEGDGFGTSMYAQEAQSTDLFETGSDYITQTNHSIGRDVLTMANGGIGGAHPFLDQTIPEYIGATDPNDNAWVNDVLSLENLATAAAPFIIKDAEIGNSLNNYGLKIINNNNTIKISVNQNISDVINLNLYNLLGQKIWKNSNNNLHEYTIESKNKRLKNGVYFIVLNQNNNKLFKRFNVCR